MDPEKKKRKKSRLRSANWTGSQTRLLLKLVKKKQKELGKVNFDRKVWNQITEALNKKSCPSHKIEQVKMRIKTLKREFNDYRMLVQMPGWGWDSERKLPTAPSETCWYEIIETNKRLSKCRTKAFLWYKLVAELRRAEVPAGENEPSGSTNDTMEEENEPSGSTNYAMEEENLLLPGAETEQSAGANSADDVSPSSGTRTRDESVPVELEEELQNNNAEEELPEVGITQTQKKQKKSRLRSANWTGSQTRLLLKLVKKKQKELGEVNFDRKVWHQITEALNKKSCPSHKIAQVKLRIRTLKKKFNDYRMLVQMPGWGWDSERKLPTAPSETCWHEIIESNKRLSKCRTKTFPWYKLVAELSRAEVPAGENEPSGSTNDTMEEENEPSGSTNYAMEEENLFLPGAETEQSAGANSADDVSPSSGTRTRDESVPVELEEELQNNNAEEELPEVGIMQTQNRVRNANWTETEHPNKQLEVLVAATPSIYKEATNNFKLVAKKLVKVRSQFKLSRSDFMDMSVVVRDELHRELFMKQEGKELLDWIKDSLKTYREQRKAHQGMQQPANRLFFMPHYPYPPGGPYTPQPQQPM